MSDTYLSLLLGPSLGCILSLPLLQGDPLLLESYLLPSVGLALVPNHASCHPNNGMMLLNLVEQRTCFRCLEGGAVLQQIIMGRHERENPAGEFVGGDGLCDGRFALHAPEQVRHVCHRKGEKL